MIHVKTLVGALAVCAFSLTPQPSRAQSAKDFRKHVEFLAHDSLEGRMTGSRGEAIAAAYIKKKLEPYAGVYLHQWKEGDMDFIAEDDLGLPFEFSLGRRLGDRTIVTSSHQGVVGVARVSFKPLEYSASGYASGSVTWRGAAPDVAGKVVFVSWFESDPHSTQASPRQVASNLADSGAVAVIFLQDSTADEYDPNYSRKTTPLSVPVLIGPKQSHFDTWQGDWEVDVNVDLIEVTGTGRNMAGLVDHGAPYTVILGAHYDHLGWGEHGSLYRGEPAIHNGADDNASGVAMIIELAKQLRKKKYKKYNYLIVAFSGEELGLYGSSYFVEHLPVGTSQVSFMLNFDMVGRYDTSRGLAINGVGTSPSWPKLLADIQPGMRIITSESGVGPSDHTPFYLHGIPVLQFFTGSHEDYHKPSDDADKVNYDGMASIADYVLRLINATDASDTLQFSKTKDSDNRDAPRFTVTLGVVPDYLFDGVGMRISGVTEDRPAAKAGLKNGDIVVKMGDVIVADMMTYMEALARFKKGETTEIVVKRGGEEIRAYVTF